MQHVNKFIKWVQFSASLTLLLRAYSCTAARVVRSKGQFPLRCSRCPLETGQLSGNCAFIKQVGIYRMVSSHFA